MAIDNVIQRARFCERCGVFHMAGEICRMGLMYDCKVNTGFCPHCTHRYRRDTTEPVEVYIPWENRLAWRSCWACFIKKLEG